MIGRQIIVTTVFCFVAVSYLFRFRRPSRNGALKIRDTSSCAPLRVLVLTAAVGGGHEAAGRTVRAELEGAGHHVVIKDGLRTMSRVLDWLLVRGYVSQVRNTPRSLRVSFALTSGRVGAAAVRAATGLLFANRLLKVMREERPDLVVSTYPLVTSALGRLRKNGGLRVPAAAIIADYGAHPLWVAPGVDLHLVVSRYSAEMVERAGGRTSLVRLPVAPEFHTAPARKEARTVLGLPQEAFIALVIGGTLGAGDLEGATRCAAESGAYTVVVTGNNHELKARLEEEFGSTENVRVLGWREDVPVLMAASDCLIQNAGGMTCIEAIEMGLPILIFDPILGHGELNARVMEQAGAARWIRTPEDLRSLLRSLARRETSLPAPMGEPAASMAYMILESLAGSDVRPVPARRVGRLRLALVGAASVSFCLWLAYSSPGMALAEKGLRLHVPGYDPSSGKISLGVKVTDPKTAAALEDLVEKENLPVTIFSDARGAGGLYPAADLSVGVAERPEDEKLSSPWSERTAIRAAAAGIQHATGEYPQYFLPASGASLATLADAPSHTQLVVPEHAGRAEPRPGLLVVDTSGLSPETAQLRLERKLREIQREGLQCVSLAQL